MADEKFWVKMTHSVEGGVWRASVIAIRVVFGLPGTPKPLYCGPLARTLIYHRVADGVWKIFMELP